LLEIDRVYTKSLLEVHTPNIIRQFKALPTHNMADSVANIKALTGIEHSHTAVRLLFDKRDGFRYLKTSHIPAKANTTFRKGSVCLQLIRVRTTPQISINIQKAKKILDIDGRKSLKSGLLVFKYYFLLFFKAVVLLSY